MALFFISVAGFLSATTVIANSLAHEDIISASVFAKANSYNFVFALNPDQSVFIVKYYTAVPTEPIIYLEGKNPVLANMEAIIKDAGVQNLTVVKNSGISAWVASKFPKAEAIIVGNQYGQDALSIAPLAAVKKSPVFFIGGQQDAESVVSSIESGGYSSVLLYGPIARQIPQALLDRLPNKRSIDTGNRYSNNLQAVSEFLQASPTTQVMFVSGRTFEKSMVDTTFPLILAGRSDVLAETSEFLTAHGITAGVVFVGDSDIVDGVTKLRSQTPGLSLFAKFGEGFTGARGGNVPQPLQIFPLPSPTINLEIVNISYNIPLKAFELRIKNSGDFAALSAGISVPGAGSSDSNLVLIDSGSETTLAIPIDASSAISAQKIPEGTLTVRYGEDSRLLDNIDTVTYKEIPVSEYQDNSSMRLTAIVYNPDTKSFEFTFDGNGYVEGTIRFSINNVPVTVRILNSKITGSGTVAVKYLLSSDEQSFIDNLPADFAIRFGGKPDVLLFESRGTLDSKVKSGILPQVPQLDGGAAGQDGGEGFPWIAVLAIAIAAIVAFAFLKGRSQGGEGFD